MPSHFCITVRFLQPFCYGRGDGDEPEWPPSPMRVFQALVAAAAARWNERTRLEYAVPALEWLAKQTAPQVIGVAGVASEVKYRTFVPDNTGDLAAGAWSRGDTTRIVKRAEKDIRPTHLTGEAVHYLYPVTDADPEFIKHKETLVTAARSITHLGWGIDMVAGNASEISEDEALKLSGVRWQSTASPSATQLRVPRTGTLKGLMEKHTAFLNRLSDGSFKPVPPLTAFDTIGYRRDTDTAQRPWVAFSILKPDASGNKSFDTPRRCRDAAAWVRHATGEVCKDWSFPNYAAFVHGHDENGNRTKGERADERFMYLPLPTINHALNRVESIRRVLIAAPPGFKDRVDWIRRRLPGQELIWDAEVVGLLNLLPTNDWVLNQYIGPKEGSRNWSTVTPVVWPGHDDRDAQKAERLLRKAFVDAGISSKLVEGITDLQWRAVGFRAGVDLASRYSLPDRLTGPRYHVRVRFPHPVRGPLAVGAGRYRGLGLFAAELD